MSTPGRYPAEYRAGTPGGARALYRQLQRLREAIIAVEAAGHDPAQLGLPEEARALAAVKVRFRVHCRACRRAFQRERAVGDLGSAQDAGGEICGPCSSALSRQEPDARSLSADALVSAGLGDRSRALRAIRALAAAGALAHAMHQWVDTLADLSAQCNCPVPHSPPPPARGAPRRSSRPQADGNDPARARRRWAGQFTDARAAMDHGCCENLTSAIPARQAIRYALCLAEEVSARIAMLHPHEPGPQL